MPCSLHILNADGKLTPWIARINAAFATSLAQVRTILPVGDVDVVVYNDADYVVPDLGMSGFCTSSRRMYLPLDIAQRDLESCFEQRFQAFLGHELHHCARRSISGYADTLGQALVTEGLACCFESELPGGTVPTYARHISGEALDAAWTRAEPLLEQPMAGWGGWFFGEQAPDIPVYAGYTLGYRIVSRWLRMHRSTAAAAYYLPASTFLAPA